MRKTLNFSHHLRKLIGIRRVCILLLIDAFIFDKFSALEFRRVAFGVISGEFSAYRLVYSLESDFRNVYTNLTHNPIPYVKI